MQFTLKRTFPEEVPKEPKTQTNAPLWYLAGLNGQQKLIYTN
uniref:Uncharacterized protein n=1 Tax=Arundo donax TaxID=35708 RepID=A0A0A8Y447_ARUDO